MHAWKIAIEVKTAPYGSTSRAAALDGPRFLRPIVALARSIGGHRRDSLPWRSNVMKISGVPFKTQRGTRRMAVAFSAVVAATGCVNEMAVLQI
jgi:hypothetical protein